MPETRGPAGLDVHDESGRILELFLFVTFVVDPVLTCLYQGLQFHFLSLSEHSHKARHVLDMLNHHEDENLQSICIIQCDKLYINTLINLFEFHS